MAISWWGTDRYGDTARPGPYDFRRAIMFSSNTYFITNGTRAGIENIVKLGRRLHLGESMKLPTHQETRGIFPSLEKIHSGWWKATPPIYASARVISM